MSFRSYDAAAVVAATPWPRLLAALESAFASPHVAPDRHIHRIVVPGAEDATALLMPAWIEGETYGVKLANIFPSNGKIGLPAVSAAYVLFDGRTGAFRALIDGGMLTARRTAATSALASRMLSRPDSSTLLMLGAGRMARLLIEAHRTVRPISRVLVWARRSEQAGALAASIGGEVVDDIDGALGKADIVSAATLSRLPLIAGANLRTGTHLDLVGAFTPEMREADAEAVARSSVFIDTLGGAKAEAGDLIQAQREKRFDWGDVVADLAALVTGAHAGRDSAAQITLFKSVGAAIEDLAAARLVAGTSDGSS
jgi:ornithine cyclodeaminase/alanine dehydrogenase-like protein (mu-crystallin family)